MVEYTPDKRKVDRSIRSRPKCDVIETGFQIQNVEKSLYIPQSSMQTLDSGAVDGSGKNLYNAFCSK